MKFLESCRLWNFRVCFTHLEPPRPAQPLALLTRCPSRSLAAPCKLIRGAALRIPSHLTVDRRRLSSVLDNSLTASEIQRCRDESTLRACCGETFWACPSCAKV